MEGKGVREVVWISSDPRGMEHCVVTREAGGWSLQGTIVRKFAEGASGITYRIETDNRWNTGKVLVEEQFRGENRELKISVNRGRWVIGDREDPALRSCKDVDLEASPATNTLPIKRAAIKVGSRVELNAAWVRFPSLRVVPLRQSYERLSGRRYVYRSASGFETRIETDGFGLVRRYGDYWTAE